MLPRKNCKKGSFTLQCCREKAVNKRSSILSNDKWCTNTIKVFAWHNSETKCHSKTNFWTDVCYHETLQLKLDCNLEMAHLDISIGFSLKELRIWSHLLNKSLIENFILCAAILGAYGNNPVGVYLLKVNNKNTRTRCEICSKLTIKTPKQSGWPLPGFLIDNFKHISQPCSKFSIVNFEHVIGNWERCSQT